MMSTYGLDPEQLVLHIIRPVLQRELGLWSPPAEVLVLGTALTESETKYVDQIDNANKPGPAFGLWQMEGRTHADIYRNWLCSHQELKQKVLRLAGYFSGDFPDPGELVGNLFYACAMCRIHYRRVPASLPSTNDAAAMAAYHKRYYNTAGGKTEVEKSIKHFQFAIDLSGSI